MMNERIRKLAKQAGLEGENGHYEYDFFDPQKFAVLIVQECMDVARQQRTPANLNYKPSERFVEDLRQHFGVE